MVQASLPPSPRFAFSGISIPVELDGGFLFGSTAPVSSSK
jgi:hypothetical protein